MKRETEDAFGADGSVYGGTAVIEELWAVKNPASEDSIG